MTTRPRPNRMSDAAPTWRQLNALEFLAVRVAAIQSRIDFRAIDEACATLDLWPSFDEMLTAYEEADP